MSNAYKTFKMLVDERLEKLYKEYNLDIYSINYMELIYDLAENESIDYSKSILTSIPLINDLFKGDSLNNDKCDFHDLISIYTENEIYKCSIFSLDGVLFGVKWIPSPDDCLDVSMFVTNLRLVQRTQVITYKYEFIDEE